MEQITANRNHPCWAPFECVYMVGNICVFREKVKEKLSALQEKHHKGERCCLDLIDIFQEPCLELDEERRSRGIENTLELKIDTA